jgi:type VI secretion system secreted protein VgrG
MNYLNIKNAPKYRYTNRFECIPYTVKYRPPLRARKPIVEGEHTAVVVGPSGEEIYTDKYGRIKVHFHWDREGQSNQDDTCWMRVASSWAGPNYGNIFIPRIGWEVVVSFLEGDPDQPLVTGCLYHALNMPPYELPAHKTRSTLKTRSSKNGAASNFKAPSSSSSMRRRIWTCVSRTTIAST